MSSEVFAREIAWHQEQAKKLRLFKMPVSEITKYTETPASEYNPKQYMFYAMNPIEGKEILDVGCGSGVTAVQFALMGAKKVIGFDLSPDYIEFAIRLAKLNEVSHICEFYEAEATTFDFGIKRFDIVYTDNVIHHLPSKNIQNVSIKIARSTKPKGCAIFREPMNSLPWLNSFKRMIGYSPVATKDERELKYSDLRTILSPFEVTDIEYFSILDRIAMLFHLKKARTICQKIDRKLLDSKPKFMSKFAGTAVMIGYRSKY